jgi:molybdenum cofactor cytidylyltransferase/nicotine blue oxidoreductase
MAGGVAAAVLAGGQGSRFGGEVTKPLAPFRGRPLVVWALESALASGLAPVVVVVGRAADEVAAVVRDAFGQRIEITRNPKWEQGIAWSMRAALEHLAGRPDVEAVCIGLADQPLMGSDAWRRVAGAPLDAPLVVATYGGVRGNPVRLARSVWADAGALEGDEGARVLLRRGPTLEVDCTGTGDPTDVDTADDLARLQRITSPTPDEAHDGRAS